MATARTKSFILFEIGKLRVTSSMYAHIQSHHRILTFCLGSKYVQKLVVNKIKQKRKTNRWWQKVKDLIWLKKESLMIMLTLTLPAYQRKLA